MKRTLLESLLIAHPSFHRKYHDLTHTKTEFVWDATSEWAMDMLIHIPNSSLAVYLSHALPIFYKNNKYHGLYHAVCVANRAQGIVMQALDKMTEEERRMESYTAWIAGLFHDAGYSLTEPDSTNVAVSAEIFTDILSRENPLQKFMDEYGITSESVIEAILCTQFDKHLVAFPVEPKSLAAKALRDADLSGHMESGWPAMLAGLAIEMGMNPDSWSDIKKFLSRQYDFISKQKMYIDIGMTYGAKRNYLVGLYKVIKEM